MQGQSLHALFSAWRQARHSARFLSSAPLPVVRCASQVNGVPTCASNFLLNATIRARYGMASRTDFSGFWVMSDCEHTAQQESLPARTSGFPQSRLL